jgi:hypothetical protein
MAREKGEKGPFVSELAKPPSPTLTPRTREPARCPAVVSLPVRSTSSIALPQEIGATGVVALPKTSASELTESA